MTQYNIFFLTPGQQPPIGSTGVVLANGGIIWIGEAGTFPTTATLGTHLDTDPVFNTTYDYRLATQAEIDEYEDILANPGE